MAYSSISKPGLHFNTKLYTGNGGTQSITGVGFQPDMIWCKARSYNDDHTITDAVRGNTKVIYPNGPAAEATSSSRITAFDSDGFSLGNSGDVNSNSATYVAWNWKANGAGSANTAGDINSTVSVNTTAGLSIVKWTGSGSVATIGHGLGVAPRMIIVKNLGTNQAWPVDCRTISGTMYLDETGTKQSYANNSPIPADAPTSTIFYVGSANNGNQSGQPMIAYCFAEKQGYSKSGSYIGNGRDDGTFVYTGFKPAFVIYKNSSSTGNWYVFDNKRSPLNVAQTYVKTNANAAEDATSSDIRLDFLSNGFKMRGANNAQSNHSGNTYFYMAFAEEPLVANVGQSIPATAR